MSASLIVTCPLFDGVWPFVADDLHGIWQRDGDVEFVRLAEPDVAAWDRHVGAAGSAERAALLGVPAEHGRLEPFSALRELAWIKHYATDPALREPDSEAFLQRRSIALREIQGMPYWGPSVAEYGLALTLCGLRRIPQTCSDARRDEASWHYAPPVGEGRPGRRGEQFGDDPRFANGTLEGKRVRVAGIGNIGGRYAKWCAMMGADVAAWDPMVPQAGFDLIDVRRVRGLDALVADAEVFAPHLSLTPETQGLVRAEHIAALPRGALVVLVTRAMVCDFAEVRRRVLADEIALAADVYDVEPLPLDDPLLGRHNVVTTPHNAGRTRQANQRFAELLAAEFGVGNGENSA